MYMTEKEMARELLDRASLPAGELPAEISLDGQHWHWDGALACYVPGRMTGRPDRYEGLTA